MLQVGHLNHVGLFKCHSNVVYFTCFDLSAASWCSRWASSVNIPVYIKGPVVSPTPSTFALFLLQEEDSDDANERVREEYGLPPTGALRWAVFEDHAEIRVMPGIRAKSSTKKTDHFQVQEIKRGGRAQSHWTLKVDKKTASLTSKRKAEEAAAALRTDLAARQPETASAKDRAVTPAPEARAASVPDTTTGELEAQAAAPDTSAVVPAAVTHEDGDEIVRGVEGWRVWKVWRERAMWW